MDRSIPEDSGANRSRVVKQTGPRTARGKAASSQNARKHGLRSKDVVIPGEDPKEFKGLLRNLRQDLRPVGALEEELVEHVVNAMWRLRRARRIETSIYYYECFELNRRAAEFEMVRVTEETALGSQFRTGAKGFETLLRYETTIRRLMSRDLDQLRKLQAERIENLDPVDLTAEVEPVEVGVPPDLEGDLDLE